jgi:ketosteroid isomerase-like protein
MPSPADVIRTAYAAFGRGDLPALLGLMSDDVEWKFLGAKGLSYTGTFRGKEGVGKWFASVPGIDDIQAFEPREFLAGGDTVTVIGWEKTKAVPSGRLYEADWVHIWVVRGGRIVRFWGMYDTEASAGARG